MIRIVKISIVSLLFSGWALAPVWGQVQLYQMQPSDSEYMMILTLLDTPITQEFRQKYVFFKDHSDADSIYLKSDSVCIDINRHFPGYPPGVDSVFSSCIPLSQLWHWGVKVNGGALYQVNLGDSVEFLDGNNVEITRSGNQITVNSMRGYLDTFYVNFDSICISFVGDPTRQLCIGLPVDSAWYFNIAANSADTTVVDFENTVNFIAGDNVVIDKAGHEITFNAYTEDNDWLRTEDSLQAEFITDNIWTDGTVDIYDKLRVGNYDGTDSAIFDVRQVLIKGALQQQLGHAPLKILADVRSNSQGGFIEFFDPTMGVNDGSIPFHGRISTRSNSRGGLAITGLARGTNAGANRFNAFTENINPVNLPIYELNVGSSPDGITVSNYTDRRVNMISFLNNENEFLRIFAGPTSPYSTGMWYSGSLYLKTADDDDLGETTWPQTDSTYKIKVFDSPTFLQKDIHAKSYDTSRVNDIGINNVAWFGPDGWVKKGTLQELADTLIVIGVGGIQDQKYKADSAEIWNTESDSIQKLILPWKREVGGVGVDWVSHYDSAIIHRNLVTVTNAFGNPNVVHHRIKQGYTGSAWYSAVSGNPGLGIAHDWQFGSHAGGSYMVFQAGLGGAQFEIDSGSVEGALQVRRGEIAINDYPGTRNDADSVEINNFLYTGGPGAPTGTTLRAAPFQTLLDSVHHPRNIQDTAYRWWLKPKKAVSLSAPISNNDTLELEMYTGLDNSASVTLDTNHTGEFHSLTLYWTPLFEVDVLDFGFPDYAPEPFEKLNVFADGGTAGPHALPTANPAQFRFVANDRTTPIKIRNLASGDTVQIEPGYGTIAFSDGVKWYLTETGPKDLQLSGDTLRITGSDQYVIIDSIAAGAVQNLYTNIAGDSLFLTGDTAGIGLYAGLQAINAITKVGTNTVKWGGPLTENTTVSGEQTVTFSGVLGHTVLTSESPGAAGPLTATNQTAPGFNSFVTAYTDTIAPYDYEYYLYSNSSQEVIQIGADKIGAINRSTSISLSVDSLYIMTPGVFLNTAVKGQFLQLQTEETGRVEFANAIQFPYLSGDTLRLTETDSFVIVDTDPSNEIQHLYISNDSLFLTQSDSTVYLPNFLSYSWVLKRGTVGFNIFDVDTVDLVPGAGIDISSPAPGTKLYEVTISHANTSSQTSVDNSSNIFIQDVALDEFGHVTNLVSAGIQDLYWVGPGEGSEISTPYDVRIEGYLELDGDLIDINGSPGTSGQVLSSLGVGLGTQWINPSGGAYTWDISADGANDFEVTSGSDVWIAGGTSINVVRTASAPYEHKFTISHADNSSQGSVNNSGDTYIQDVTLDALGHVTGLASKQHAYPVYASVNINNSGNTFLQDFTSDGTGHVTSVTSAAWTHPNTSDQANVNNSGNFFIQDVTLDDAGHVTALVSAESSAGYGWWIAASGTAGADPVTNDETVQLTAGTSMNVTRVGSNVTIAHADNSSQASVDNSGQTFIQDVTLDALGHVTGLASAAASSTYTWLLAASGTAGTQTINDGNTATITAGTGITSTRVGANVTISHAVTGGESSIDNSNNIYIQDITLDGFGHITGMQSSSPASQLTNAGSNVQVEADGDFIINLAAGGSDFVRFQSGDITTAAGVNLGVGRVAATYGLEVGADAGKTVGGSSWQVISDKRVKKNIRYISDAYDQILALKPASFQYRNAYKRRQNIDSDATYYNFIAQDYEQVFPDQVNKMDEFMTISTDAAQMYTVAAVQQLIREVQNLKDRIAELENK